jgi:hypothetical protein
MPVYLMAFFICTCFVGVLVGGVWFLLWYVHRSGKGLLVAAALNLALVGVECLILLPVPDGRDIRPLTLPLMWLAWEFVGLCIAAIVLATPRAPHKLLTTVLSLAPIFTGWDALKVLMRIKGLGFEQ